MGVVGSCRLPGLKELGLDVLYEVGQMGFFSWREKLWGPRYGHAGGDRGGEGEGSGKADDCRFVSVRKDFWSVIL